MGNVKFSVLFCEDICLQQKRYSVPVRDTFFQFVRISACKRKDTLPSLRIPVRNIRDQFSHFVRIPACNVRDTLFQFMRIPACKIIDTVFKSVRIVASKINDIPNAALTLFSIDVSYQKRLCELQHFGK
jgi:hypothetical protein